jgi:hypothetical protein
MNAKSLAFCALLGVATALGARAQETVTATGTAAILDKDAAQARDRAVESALRAAVERVVGTMVDSESLVKNNDLISDKIYTQTRGYISNYTILSETPDLEDNIYSVKVEATVKEGNLADDLNSLGLLMRRMNMPRVAVALQEQDSTASDQILKMLKDRGFLVVDTGESAKSQGFWAMPEGQQADLMNKYGAEVVVLGSARGQAGSNVGGSSLISYQANVSLKALKTDTHELLGAASGSGAAVNVGDAGLAQALRQASTVAGNDLIRQITNQWAKEASSTRMLTLVLRGVTPARAEEVARRLREEGRGIQEVIVRESFGQEATLDVSMQGDAAALAQELTKVFPKARIVSQTANRLTASL